jgi:DNA-binding response OmpR family regulator
MDDHTRRVWLHEKEIIPPLSVQQFKLLHCLYENNGEVISRDQIIQTVWGLKEGEGVTEQALDALVRRLRDRLAEFDKHHNYLYTVRGYGIRLDNPRYE